MPNQQPMRFHDGPTKQNNSDSDGFFKETQNRSIFECKKSRSIIYLYLLKAKYKSCQRYLDDFIMVTK